MNELRTQLEWATFKIEQMTPAKEDEPTSFRRTIQERDDAHAALVAKTVQDERFSADVRRLLEDQLKEL